MSELIRKNDSRATFRWRLLATASAAALTAYVCASNAAKAGEPMIWLEFGGQMDDMSGLSSPFTAPFMSVQPSTPGTYSTSTFTDLQRPPRLSFGAEGKISFRPDDSDWVFSAGIRYGRALAKRHSHHQSAGISAIFYSFYSHQPLYTTHLSNDVEFNDVTTQDSERHAIVDFSAGKDVGLGLFGKSTISAGLRIVDVKNSSSATIYARPIVTATYAPPKYSFPEADFIQYTLSGKAERSFKGLGPSLAWNASAGLAGNEQNGELTLDWGINAALLFGKQKAKIQHNTLASQYGGYPYAYEGPAYPPRNVHLTRSRSVTIPNVGGFAGLSAKYSDVKISVGYRADIFFRAMDTGIDTRKDSDLTFHGPYASVSIGLGN